MAVLNLGSRSFTSKRAAAKAASDVLNGTRLDEPLIGEPRTFIEAVLMQHPGVTEKTANGVSGIVVRRVEVRPGLMSRCFHVIHPDGTETDFSFNTALGLAQCGPTLEKAARRAIAGTVKEVKWRYFAGRDEAPCELTGVMLTPGSAHVDHAPPWPFRKILTEFVIAHGGIPALRNYAYGTVFAHDNDRTEFLAFHDQRAVLRVISASANLSRIGDKMDDRQLVNKPVDNPDEHG